MEDKIIVINRIEETQDDRGKKYLKVIDKAGDTHNIKEGQRKLLTNKGHLLKEGVAIKLHFQDYKSPDGKVFPFISDFEEVKDAFIQQAAKKAQSIQADTREASIEAQVAFKGLIELCVSSKLEVNHPVIQIAITWAITKLGGKYETRKDNNAPVVHSLVDEKGDIEQLNRIKKLTLQIWTRGARAKFAAHLKTHFLKENITDLTSEELNALEEQLEEVVAQDET